MSYIPLAHVSTGELATAALHNTLLDNIDYLYDRLALGSAGIPFFFGGSDTQGNVGTTYPSGAGADKLVPNSGILYVPDCSIFVGVTMALEVMLRVEAGGTATLSLFNLTDAPDTALTNSTVTSTDATGERKRTTLAITMPTSGAKAFGLKQHSAHATAIEWAYGGRFFPLD